MSYLAIDFFKNKTNADVTAEAFRQAGRKNVVIKEKDSMIVNDCRTEPHKALVDIDAAPLYIVLSEK
ncbi:MAG: hypothetical protein EHM85_16670 [Desulfobacteraceae bacterium]|nr:MAG: hypothetical protein EHM85_16670 [Desulfobacteraceae bacterium]